MMNVLQVLTDVLLEILSIGKDSVVPTATLVEDLGADDLDLVEIFMDLEDRTGLVIPDADVDGLKTVQQVVDYLEGRLSAVGK